MEELRDPKLSLCPWCGSNFLYHVGSAWRETDDGVQWRCTNCGKWRLELDGNRRSPPQRAEVPVGAPIKVTLLLCDGCFFRADTQKAAAKLGLGRCECGKPIDPMVDKYGDDYYVVTTVVPNDA